MGKKLIQFLQKPVFLAFSGLLLASAVIYLGYFLDRTEFQTLILGFTLAFLGHLGLIYRQQYSKYELWLGIALRAVLLFSIPTLSDDYFRFTWDGLISSSGHNPFSLLPTDYLNHSPKIPGLTQELYQQLNSPNYFTIYPPVCQFFFWLSAVIGEGELWKHLLVLRSGNIVAEILSLYFLSKLLKSYQLPARYIRFYAYNPLVIIELVGNLHFEAWMIAGLLGALYFFQQNKLWGAIVFLSIAIQVKLLPLMLLPALLPALGWKKSAIVYLSIALLLALGFSPFIDEATIHNLSSSIDLYFRRFEFNASIYYLVRWVGYQVIGYNIIQQAGPYLSLAVLLAILIRAFSLSYHKAYIPVKWFWTFIFYLLGATIVHPWYILILIPLGLFTRYRFPMLWSFSILGSYAAYQTSEYKENLWLVGASYSLVLAFACWEAWKKKPTIIIF